MATFGEMINLQPYILNWLVNGENENLARRSLVSSKAVAGNKVKNTYEGNYTNFIDNYILPGKYNPAPTAYEFNGTTSYSTFSPYVIGNVEWSSMYSFDVEITFSFDQADLTSDMALVSSINNGSSGNFYIKLTSSNTLVAGCDSGGLYDVMSVSGANFDLLTDGEVHTVKYSLDASTATYSSSVSIDGNIVATNSVGESGMSLGTQLLVGATSTAGTGGAGDADFFKGSIYRVVSNIDGTIAIDCSNFVTGANTGTSGTGTSFDIVEVVAGVYPEADRKETFKIIDRNKLLKSLIEYKRRWNINKDSATLKIDYVGFKGDKLVVKTTEEIKTIFGTYNGVDSITAWPALDLSSVTDQTGLMVTEVRFRRASSSVVASPQVLAGVGGGNTLLLLPDASTLLYVPDFGGAPITPTISLDNTDWHTVRVEQSLNDGAMVYIDGVLQDPVIGSPGAPNWGVVLPSPTTASIGSDNEVNWFEGDIDYMKFKVGPLNIANVQDPSTGVNLGIGGDALVNNVTQGIV